MIPSYSYLKKGKPSQVLHPQRNKSLSIICAILKKGILGIQMFEGSITGNDFAGFLMGLLRAERKIRENIS